MEFIDIMANLFDSSAIEHNTLPYIKENCHLSLPFTLIKYFGTWPPSSCHRSLYLKYTWFIITSTVGLGLTTQFINLFAISEDVSRTSSTVFLLMTNFAFAYKLWTFLTNQQEIQKLLDTIQSMEIAGGDKICQRIATWYTWNGIFYHVIYQTPGILSVFCWCLSPVVQLIVRSSRRLIMESWYPYNVNNSPAFELTNFYQSLVLLYTCLHNMTIDVIIVGFINVATCQLKIVEHNISNLDGVGNSNAGISTDKILDEKLAKCVEHSVHVLEFIKEIQKIFGTAITAQISVNSVIICLIAFYLSQVSFVNPLEIIAMITFMIGLISEIYLFCCHGNEVTVQGHNLKSAIYLLKWWKFGKKLKLSLSIIGERFNSPLIFTICPTLKLSLQTFLTVIQLSYSFFTVLRNTST